MVFSCFFTITTFNFIFRGKTGGGEQPLNVSDGSPPPLQVDFFFLLFFTFIVRSIRETTGGGDARVQDGDRREEEEKWQATIILK